MQNVEVKMYLCRFLLCFLLCVSTAHAEVFKCIKHSGAIVFKDTPCSKRDLQVLSALQEQPVNKDDVAQMQQKYKQHQAEARRQKQELRQQQKASKQKDLEAKRRLRLQAKCETVKHQITQLRQRYRQGYTAKQGLALDRRLAECKFKEQKYCK
jgi:hypothetical protein